MRSDEEEEGDSRTSWLVEERGSGLGAITHRMIPETRMTQLAVSPVIAAPRRNKYGPSADGTVRRRRQAILTLTVKEIVSTGESGELAAGLSTHCPLPHLRQPRPALLKPHSRNSPTATK